MLVRLVKRYQIALILAAALSILVAKILIKLPEHLKFELEVELLSPAGGVATLYCDDGRGYRSEKRIDFPYNELREVAPSIYRFSGRLPCGLATKKIRFDPVWADGEVILRSFKLRTYRWMSLDLEKLIGNEFKIVNAIDEFELINDGIRIKSAGHDPIVELTDNVGSYFELRKFDLLFTLTFLTIIFAISLKILQSMLSVLLLHGPRIESLRLQLEKNLDNFIDRLQFYVLDSYRIKRPINLMAYFFSFCVSFYGTWLFLSNIYPGVSLSFVVAFVGTQATILLLIKFIAIVGALFRNSSNSWLFPGFSILLACAYVADAQLFRLNGMHINHGLQILFEGGIGNFQKNLEFTKLSKSLLVIYEVILLVLVAGAFITSYFLGRLRLNSTVSFSWVSYLCLVTVLSAVIFSEQWVSRSIKPQSLWAMEQNDIPSYFPIFEAKDFIFEYPVEIGAFRYKEIAGQGLLKGTSTDKKDIYLFILESVRDDLLDEIVAPNLSEFRNNSLTFTKAMANGNATHYGWYSIVNSRVPLYWESYKNKKYKKGSESLLVLKKMGYRINVHSSKDLSYLGADNTMFGSDHSLLDYITDYRPESIPAMDLKVTETLVDLIDAKNRQDPSINIIFWDSTHYPYRWPKGMDGERIPYAGSEEAGVSLNKAREMAINEPDMILNRYRNSIKFADSLFGRFIQSLKAQGRYDDSIVIVVGDHGQQFMEHNYLMHGRTLFAEDLHIPLYVHAPGYGPRKIDRVASQIDIMPTILELVDAKGVGTMVSDGKSLLSDDVGLSYGVAAAAGFKNTPFRHVAEVRDWKLIFDLDKNDPLSSKKLLVRKIYDAGDREFIPGSGSQEEYRKFLEENFDGLLKDLPFLKVVGEPT